MKKLPSLLIFIFLALTPAMAGAVEGPVDGPTTDPSTPIVDPGPTPTAESKRIQNSLKNNPIVKDIQNITNFLSALAGIVIIGSFIFAGVQYSAAGNNAQAVGAAKTRITNTLIALAAFLLIFVFLQWLIPGGLFNS